MGLSSGEGAGRPACVELPEVVVWRDPHQPLEWRGARACRHRVVGLRVSEAPGYRPPMSRLSRSGSRWRTGQLRPRSPDRRPTASQARRPGRARSRPRWPCGCAAVPSRHWRYRSWSRRTRRRRIGGRRGSRRGDGRPAEREVDTDARPGVRDGLGRTEVPPERTPQPASGSGAAAARRSGVGVRLSSMERDKLRGSAPTHAGTVGR